MSTFKLTIELGNDAMRTHKHVARALRAVANSVADGEISHVIRDDNGNTVGQWVFYVKGKAESNNKCRDCDGVGCNNCTLADPNN